METWTYMTADDLADADEARRDMLEEREQEQLELLRTRSDEDRGAS